MAQDNFNAAMVQPVIHPWETAHELFWGGKANFKSAYKLTDLISSTLEVLQGVFPETMPSFSDFRRSCATFKNIGKLIEAEGLTYNYCNGELLRPAPNAKHPLAKSDYINLPLYALKITALTTGTVAQTYLICKKYVHPQFFAKVGQVTVKNFGAIASRVGGTNLEAAAKVVTTAGAVPIKHVGLIIFLAIDAYQLVSRFNNSEKDTFESVYYEIKSLENISKIAVISMCLFGAPTLLIAGTGLVTAYFSVTSLYQKQTM